MIKEHNNFKAPVMYNPSALIKLAKVQFPQEKDFIEQLAKCTEVVGFCNCGCGDVYFIDPKSPEWKFQTCITLEQKEGLYLILDVMKNGSIGRVEVFKWPVHPDKSVKILVD